MYTQKKKIQGEFNVTEKVKRKKGNHIPSRRFFKDTFFEGESYLSKKTNAV